MKNIRKYFACDINGTLLHNGTTINDEDKKAISQFRQNGGVFILSTGRTISSIHNLVQNHNIEFDYLVLGNGSHILDGDLKTIKETFVDNSIVKNIVSTYHPDKDIVIWANSGIDGFVLGATDGQSNKYISKGLLSGYINRLKPLHEVLDESINYQMMSIGLISEDRIKAEKIKNDISNKYNNVQVFRNTHFVDIAPNGCSKGDGLLFLKDFLKIGTWSLSSIGDSYNDISMFKVSNTAFTFPTSEEAIKENVHHIVNTVTEALSTL